ESMHEPRPRRTKDERPPRGNSRCGRDSWWYRRRMRTVTSPSRPRGLARILSWRRLRLTLIASLLLGLLLSPGWQPGPWSVLARAVSLGLFALLVFGMLEQWPQRLPPRLARWALQILGVALAMPVGAFVIYVVSTPAGAPWFWHAPLRLRGFAYLTFLGLLVGP